MFEFVLHGEPTTIRDVRRGEKYEAAYRPYRSLPDQLAGQSKKLGTSLARLRIARAVKQQDAALRAGLSRTTAYRLEHGDPGIAVGQVLRYLDAIAPGKSLLELLSESDPALVLLRSKETRHRVRDLTSAELEKLDFWPP